MTTEDDFQAMLDANPDDWQTRLIFADWLEERGDARAEGYRALASLRVWPSGCNEKNGVLCYHNGDGTGDKFLPLEKTAILPQDWLDRTQDEEHRKMGYGDLGVTEDTILSSCIAPSRAFLEDAAALAFAKLPARRRAELLSAPLTSST